MEVKFSEFCDKPLVMPNVFDIFPDLKNIYRFGKKLWVLNVGLKYVDLENFSDLENIDIEFEKPFFDLKCIDGGLQEFPDAKNIDR